MGSHAWLISKCKDAAESLNGFVWIRTSCHRSEQPQGIISKAWVRLMDKILHDPKDPKLFELWYIPYNG